MQTMQNATVIQLQSARDRSRRVNRAVDARRNLRERGERRNRSRATGRVWLNGRELGGARSAFEHLAESYD